MYYQSGVAHALWVILHVEYDSDRLLANRTNRFV